MRAFPQLSTGALVQFPLIKKRTIRTVVNRTEDDHEVRSADEGGGRTEWELQFTALSDEERRTLESFFTAVEGSLTSFTFLDPLANLLARSGELDQAEWEKDPALSLSGGVPDPRGTS